MRPPTITDTHPPIALTELVDLIRTFPTMSVDGKRVTIERLVAVHPTVNLHWSGDWRYRRCRNLSGFDVPDSVDQLVWRTGLPAQLGRANPPGFQVIYLADRTDTAFQEARVVDGPAVVTDFTIRRGRHIRVAPIGELAQIQRTGRGYLSGDSSNEVSQMLNACPVEHARALLITDAFLLDCLAGQDDYEISSHVALSVLEKHDFITAIAYPSRRQIGAVNFAVRVKGFWEDWAISAVRYGHTRHLAVGYFETTDAQAVRGINDSGGLLWKHVGQGVSLELEPPYFPPAFDIQAK